MTWYRKKRWLILRDPARGDNPWALNVSFIAPHFPYIVPQRFWDSVPA